MGIESDVTHDDVTGGSSAPADKGTDRRSTQAVRCQPRPAHHQSLAARRREARDARVQPSDDLCIVATGVVQGMGSGTLFVRYCGRAGRSDSDMGINNDNTKSDSPRY